MAGDLADRAPAEILRRDGEADHRKAAGDDQALVERAHDRVVGAELDEARADDRGDDADGADRQRIEHGVHQPIRRRLGEEDRRQHHGRHDRHRIGLEQVGRHAGAVADIVTDIVGNGRRIARIVLGNARLDLADEVGADVGALGEDAAAETREDRDQRGAEAQGHQRVDHIAIVGAEAHWAGQDIEIDGNAEQGETGDQQAGDRAGLEGDVEAARQRLRRGLRGAHIGADRHVHADEAGGARQDRADQEANGGLAPQQEAQRHADHHADDPDGEILPLQIGLGAFGDRRGDFLHARRTRVRRHHAFDRDDAIDYGEKPAQYDEPNSHYFRPFLYRTLSRPRTSPRFDRERHCPGSIPTVSGANLP